MLKTLLSLFIITTFLVANENNKCIVPNILIETIKITENERKYPFLIRTNETSTLKDFKDIASSFEYKKTKDNMVIDCINLENCTNISNALIKNNITNIDLGLFQINYNSFKYPLYSYFDGQKSYLNACKIVKEKIKMNKGKWDWQVLASYHSMTPKYNKVYKEKLIKNYIKLTNNDNYSPSHYSAASKKEVEDVLVMQ
ncbi:hypothetical protein N3114_05830 [Aliarcobacter butzleri]|jgi:hypothetical protein|uniref:hypothetical protein n=1 Tax=Aliarcobacter butzleri TaxID=28197 RepID=UPI0021B477B2|nr:hypothetical protein [Aliarcobacter butzleri]UXC30538.1 hypothetical protein N3114_05830 [Aliarcobacter butzleri]